MENSCDFLVVLKLGVVAWSGWGQWGSSGQEAAEIFVDYMWWMRAEVKGCDYF